MTTKAPSMEPVATPNELGAAPPAGGASAADVELAPALDPLVIVAVEETVLLIAPDVADILKLADPPTALLLTVLTAPEIVAKLLCTLATLTLGVTLLIALLVDAVFGNVTWIRISSHCAPMYSSYRL
jgi:hypothetical protein